MKKHRYSAIGQAVCKTGGWSSSIGLPRIFFEALSQRAAERKAVALYRKSGDYRRGCKIHASVVSEDEAMFKFDE